MQEYQNYKTKLERKKFLSVWLRAQPQNTMICRRKDSLVSVDTEQGIVSQNRMKEEEKKDEDINEDITRFWPNMNNVLDLTNDRNNSLAPTASYIRRAYTGVRQHDHAVVTDVAYVFGRWWQRSLWFGDICGKYSGRREDDNSDDEDDDEAHGDDDEM